MSGPLIVAAVLLLLVLLLCLPVGGEIRYGQDGIRGWVRAGPISVCVYPHKPGKKKRFAQKKKENQAAAPNHAAGAVRGSQNPAASKPTGGGNTEHHAADPDEKTAAAKKAVGKAPLPASEERKSASVHAEQGLRDGPRKHKKSRARTAKREAKQDRGGPIGTALDTLPLVQQLLPLALEAAEVFQGKLRMDKLELCILLAGEEPDQLALRYGQANALLGAAWLPLNRAFRVVDGSASVRLDWEGEKSSFYADLSLSIRLGQVLWLGAYFGARALIRIWKVQQTRRETGETHRKAV